MNKSIICESVCIGGQNTHKNAKRSGAETFTFRLVDESES